jgi:tetratricopeptide (TPR) repeat protein
VLTLVVGFAALGTASAQDIDQWNRNKKDCEYVLKAPDRYPLDSIQECTMLWEQYRDVSGLSPDEKKLFARGFSWLYLYGDTNQKGLANGALSRIGKKEPLKLVNGEWVDSNIGQVVRTNTTVVGYESLPKVAVVDPGKAREKKSSALNSKGHKKYKRRQYAAAIQDFEKALELDPFSVKAKYNLACNQALVGDTDGAVRTLLELQSWDSGSAQAAFSSARMDKDFTGMHGDERFRRMLGLIRIQVLNGAKEPGLYHVSQIRKKFLDRKMPVAQYGYDRHIRQRPYVWYRKGYEAQAAVAKEIVANHRTGLLPISWDSPFDIIVSYGDPDVAEQANVGGPLVQGEGVKDKGNAADDLLNGVKDVKDKVDDTKSTATDTAGAIKEP